jgi:hypothetical protein
MRLEDAGRPPGVEILAEAKGTLEEGNDLRNMVEVHLAVRRELVQDHL